MTASLKKEFVDDRLNDDGEYGGEDRYQKHEKEREDESPQEWFKMEEKRVFVLHASCLRLEFDRG
jgi:hypothetical protein